MENLQEVQGGRSGFLPPTHVPRTWGGYCEQFALPDHQSQSKQAAYQFQISKGTGDFETWISYCFLGFFWLPLRVNIIYLKTERVKATVLTKKKGRGKSCPKHVSVVCGLCGVCVCFSFFNSLQGDRDMSATIRALKSNRTALEAKPAAQVLCVWPSPGGP